MMTPNLERMITASAVLGPDDNHPEHFFTSSLFGDPPITDPAQLRAYIERFPEPIERLTRLLDAYCDIVHVSQVPGYYSGLIANGSASPVRSCFQHWHDIKDSRGHTIHNYLDIGLSLGVNLDHIGNDPSNGRAMFQDQIRFITQRGLLESAHLTFILPPNNSQLFYKNYTPIIGNTILVGELSGLFNLLAGHERNPNLVKLPQRVTIVWGADYRTPIVSDMCEEMNRLGIPNQLRNISKQAGIVGRVT